MKFRKLVLRAEYLNVSLPVTFGQEVINLYNYLTPVYLG